MYPGKQAQTERWIARRKLRGVAPTSDQIWEYIKKTFPALTDAEKEDLFQSLRK